MRRSSIFLLVFLFFAPAWPAPAADPAEPEPLPIHLTAEEETRLHEIGMRHRDTPPPGGAVRNPAEWEPSEGVIIRWPLGISIDIVAEMSEDVVVTTIVASESQKSSAMNAYASGGVNMSNTEFVIAPTDSYWTRDYGPWFIFHDGVMAITDPIYNRPRPYDDVIPQVIGDEWRMDVFGLDLIHSGGNHMSNGLGTSASTELVYHENPGKTPAEIQRLMLDYLGNDYTVLEYIESGGIHHIDCWAKFLGPKTVMVKEVDPGHPSHGPLDDRADFLAQQISPWGVPYEVVRVYCPSGTAYTNSLILNDKVLVPTFGSSWDAVALQTYADAMPGYEILGFPGSWLDNDALHCRAMGVPDRGMLFIEHVPFRTEDITYGDYPIEARIVAHSGEPLIEAQLRVKYQTDGGLWLGVPLTGSGEENVFATSIPAQSEGASVRYYIEAADASGRIETHPTIGAAWAHEFTALCPNHPLVDVTPDGPLFACTGDEVLLEAGLTGGQGPFGFQWLRDGSPVTGGNAESYLAGDDGSHVFNCEVHGAGCVEGRSDSEDVSITWQDHPVFDGAVSADSPGETTCSLDVTWEAATPLCGATVYYDLYRSMSLDFVPGPENLLVSGLAGTTFHDSHELIGGSAYAYVVRARDDSNGAGDENVTIATGTPGGPATTGEWLDDCESSARFETTGLWAVVDDSTCATPGYFSPTHAYYFGIDGGPCNFDTGSTVNGSLTGEPITGVEASSWLSFASYLHTEQVSGYDRAFVEISSDDGESWIALDSDASNGGSIPDGGGAWYVMDYPIGAWAGEQIRIRFRFDSVDEVNNGETGWLVDDVTVTDVLVPGPCSPGVGCLMTVNVTPNGSVTACAGETIVLTATPSGGEAGYTFQWTEDGVPLPGETGDILTIAHDSAGAHVYNCRVTDNGVCSDVVDGLDVVGEWVVCGSVVAVPDGSEGGTTPLAVARDGGGLTITWDASTPGCTSSGYHLLWGRGADVADYVIAGSDCTLDDWGIHAWVSAPDTSADWAWFLVVGNDGATTEGGWGSDSEGNPRSTSASGACGTSEMSVEECVP